MLKSERLRQLRQRITFSYTLRALTKDEVAAYVDHRMRTAGHQGKPLFNASAKRALYKYSKGIPRLTNVMCHKAMMLAYGSGSYEIKRKQIVAAAKDTDAVLVSQNSPFKWLVAGATLAASGWYSYLQWGSQIQGWWQ